MASRPEDRLTNRPSPRPAALDQGQRDLIAVVLFIMLSYVAALQLDLFDVVHGWSRAHEDWEVDEIFGALFISTFGLFLYGLSRARETVRELRLRIAAEARAKEMAMHDALTGLPNRRRLLAELHDRLAPAQHGDRLAVIALDLDRFKPVNDLYGHGVGDELLVIIADLIRERARPDGLAARLGGDEFVILLACPSDEELIGWLTTLTARFERTFDVAGHEVSVGATLGIAVAPTDGDEPEILLRRADVALYRAKEAGRGRFAFFEPGMDERVQERAALETELRRAVRDGAIEPHFQPLVDLASGEVRGYEILARWRHVRLGLVPPDRFIPIAEETGLIDELTMGVLRRACRDACALPGAPRISLNISPVQLRDSALPQKILKTLAECGFPPGRLEVEVTEDALVSDFEGARRILVSLKNQGVHIALDDFGTGYSSLRHLRELPFDVLKIDQSFIHSMNESSESLALVRTIVSLAKNMGLGVTAEGVETPEHVQALRALGCELGQGYHFGRPASAASIAALLKETAPPDSAPAFGQTAARAQGAA